MPRPTMTLKECAETMRNSGFRISERTIGEGITSGRYPFGTVVRIGKSGRRSFEIFRVQFEKWLKEYTGNE